MPRTRLRGEHYVAPAHIEIEGCDVSIFLCLGTTTPWLAHAAEVGNIEVCYNCSHNFDSLGVLDGPTFEINNLTSTPLTNVMFTANGDTYNVGTIAGSASVFLVPGVSNDSGTHTGFWQVTGSILIQVTVDLTTTQRHLP